MCGLWTKGLFFSFRWDFSWESRLNDVSTRKWKERSAGCCDMRLAGSRLWLVHLEGSVATWDQSLKNGHTFDLEVPRGERYHGKAEYQQRCVKRMEIFGALFP